MSWTRPGASSVGRDVALQRLEPAAAHADGSPCLARSASRALTGKISGLKPSSARALSADEGADLLDLRARFEDVDLVDDDDDLLAPAADLLEERALGFGERAVGGGHEQHEVRARDELRGDRFVLADDGVGAGRVDDVDVAQDRRGRGDDVQVGVA